MSPDVHTLTGAYALDALPDDEQREFEEHLAQCEACRREVAELRATAARLAAPVAEQPPPGLRNAVLDIVDQTRQERPGSQREPASRPQPRPQRPRQEWLQRQPPPTPRADRREEPSNVVQLPARRPWAQRLVGAAAAVLAVVVISLSVLVGNLNSRLDQVETEATAMASVLSAEEVDVQEVGVDSGGTARVVAAPGQDAAAFFASGMQPVPSGRTYQLWLMQDGQPAPAGLFKPNEDGHVAQALQGDVRSAEAVAVTVEPDGGSPQPTSEPLVVMEL